MGPQVRLCLFPHSVTENPRNGGGVELRTLAGQGILGEAFKKEGKDMPLLFYLPSFPATGDWSSWTPDLADGKRLGPWALRDCQAQARTPPLHGPVSNRPHSDLSAADSPRPAAAPPTPSRAGPQNQPAAGGASLPPQREATMATGAVLQGSCPARHADTRGWSGAVARGRGQHTESRTPGHTDAKRCLKPDSDWRPAKSSTFTILLGRRRGSWSDLELSWQRLAG